MSTEPPSNPLADPKAQLEQALRAERLRALGFDEASLAALPSERRLEVLRALSRQVAMALAEMDARAHYVREIHGVVQPE